MQLARFAKFAGALVALLVAALAVFVLTFDANRYKPLLESAALSASGRALHVERDLTLSLLPRPALRAEGVSLANAGWGSRPEMLRVGRFAAEVSLVSLLRGAPEVRRVVLEDVDLLLETNAEGEANWALAPAGSIGPPTLPAPTAPPIPAEPTPIPGPAAPARAIPLVRALALHDARVSYHDAGSGRTRTLTLARADLATNGPDAPLAIDLEGSIDTLEFQLTGEIGSVNGLFAAETPWPLQLRGTLGDGLALALEGTIARPREARGLALRVRLESPDLERFAASASVAAPIAGPLALSFLLSDPAPRRFAFGELAATLAAGEVHGTASLTLDGPRPSLDAELASPRFDLDRLGGGGTPPAPSAVDTGPGAGAPASDSGPPSAASTAPHDGRLVSGTPLPFGALRSADAQLRFRSDAVLWRGLTLRAVTGELRLRDGELAPLALRGGLAGGRLELDTTLSAASQRVGAKLGLTGVDVGMLLRESGRSDLVRRAPTELRIDVHGAGATRRDVAASLGGSVVSITHDAEVDSRALDLLGDAAALWKPLAADGGMTRLSCVIGRFDLRGGIAHAIALFADAGALVVSGEGSIDLGRESLALVLTPRAQVERLENVPVPLQVHGSLAKPRFSADVVSTALGAAQRFGGKKLRKQADALATLLGVASDTRPTPTCAQAEAVARGRALPPTPSATPPATPDGEAKPGRDDAVRSLERGLRDVLGR